MLSLSKLQTIIVYPVVLADMYSDDIKKYTEGATGLELELEEMLPGKPPKGYADYLVFLMTKETSHFIRIACLYSLFHV
jgi:hypothetical protein